MKRRFFASILGFSLALTAPVAAPAQSLDATTCRNAFDALRDKVGGVEISADSVSAIAGWCRITNLRVETKRPSESNFLADQVEVQGDAIRLMLDPTQQPTGLRLRGQKVRVVPPSMDIAPLQYIYDKMAIRGAFSLDLDLEWSAASNALNLKSLLIDFGDYNQIAASVLVKNVDLSSAPARERSLTSFAVTNLNLRIATKGLFETYMLMPLAFALLPSDGSDQDMEAAVTARKGEAVALVNQLPEASVSAASKAALGALIKALPNPTGELTLSMRATEGFGPVRFAGFALRGMPKTVAEAAPLLNGVVLDFGWKPVD